MAASATIIVKITNGTEIRRFTAQSNHLSWSSLSKNASSLFDLPMGSNLKLTYVDDEGDKITLSSDEELSEAVGLSLKNSPAVLRLTVVSTDRKKWRSITTSYDDKKGVLSWTHMSLKDVCYFAYFAPYTMEMHADLLSRCAVSPIARIQTLGATLDGRAMDCVVAGTGPMHAWINSRQHCFNALV